MATPSSRIVPVPTSEQRRIASENYDRAKQVALTGNHDYAIDLLLTCCQIDPANVSYRMALRKSQKEKYGNNLKGSSFSMLTTPGIKAKMKSAKRSREYLKVLELGEQVLTKNPWDLGSQIDMAEAFEALNLLDLAVLTLDQARQKYPRDPALNRQLARLFEKRGDFARAIALWQIVREEVPTDVEASHKAKDLAASETIARGQYEESVSGTKASPVIERIEQRAVEQQDRLGRDVEALQKRIEASPNEPSLYLQLSLMYRKAGKEDRAKATLNQALTATGNHFIIRQELIELDLHQFREEHKEWQDKHTEIDEESSEDAVEIKQKIAQLVNDIHTKEVELARLRIERTPNDFNAHLELGQKLLDVNKLDEAISALQTARKDEKLKGKSCQLLGHSFNRKNNWRLAQRNFEEALNILTPSEEEIRKDVLYHLALGCAENNEVKRALDLGHELANIDYGYKNIGQLLDQWEGR